MKRSDYKVLIALLCALPLFSSCDLTEPVQAQADKYRVFGSESGLELYARSFYRALPTLANGFRQDEMCDYAAVSNTNTFITDGAYTAETSTSWSWGTLRNINYFIDGCNDPEYCTVSEDIKNHYLGLARWFRAWFYYDKLVTYGEVPWFPNEIQAYERDVMYKDRDSRDVIIRNMIDDLDFAYNNIQTTSSTGNSLISKWAAMALKSRVCLFEGSYRRYHGLTGLEITAEELLEEAIAASRIVMGAGFSLNASTGSKGAYRELFYREAPITTEIILAVCASEDSSILGEQNWWYNSASYGVGWSLSRAFVHTYLKLDGTPFTDQSGYDIKLFPEEMSDRDLRLEQTVRGRDYKMDDVAAVSDIKSVSTTGYQAIKFTLDESRYEGGARNINSIPIIRYAEVLLNYAEAMAELGLMTDTEWNTTVGAIRRRAGITGGGGDGGSPCDGGLLPAIGLLSRTQRSRSAGDQARKSYRVGRRRNAFRRPAPLEVW